MFPQSLTSLIVACDSGSGSLELGMTTCKTLVVQMARSIALGEDGTMISFFPGSAVEGSFVERVFVTDVRQYI